MRILFFGDSITYGLSDPLGGWVQRLRSEYQKLPGDKHEVYNLGVVGNLAENLVKRMALETDARRWYDEKLLIVVAVGVNDTKFKGEDVASTPELYQGELEQILSIARQYTEQVLFVGLTPVNEELTNPYDKSLSGSCFSNQRVEAFDKILHDFCSENVIPFVDVYRPFLIRQGKENLLAGGLHPNEAGHQLIAELVRPELDSLL